MSALRDRSVPDPLYSDRWPQVQGLRLRLRASVQVGRQRVRGEDWFIYQDASTQRSARVNAAAHAFVGRLNGVVTAASVWDSVVEDAGDAAPSQEEIVDVLQQLTSLGLMTGMKGVDLQRLRRIEDRRRERELLKSVNPLSFTVPIADPTRWLDRVLPWTRWMATGWFALLATLFMVVVALSALPELPELIAYAGMNQGTPRFLLAIAVVYPVMKLFHELAHALVIRTSGGQVRGLGVSMLMLVPMPYVDASDATMFPQRSRRIAVSAAGIVAELLMAAVAYLVWSSLADGLARLLAYAVLFTALFSTLVVNGNPLMRFDGYHVLSDLLSIPNLAPRAQALWNWIGRRVVAGESTATAPSGSAAEWGWLLLYGLVSWLYQWLVAWFVLTWIVELSRPLALLLALVMGHRLVLRPLLRILRYLGQAGWRQSRPWRAWAGVTGCAVLLLGALWSLRVPEVLSLEGIVVPGELASIRAPEDGLVAEMLVLRDARVQPGTPLMRLVNLPLQAELEAIDAELAEVAAQRIAAIDGGDAGRNCVAYDINCEGQDGGPVAALGAGQRADAGSGARRLGDARSRQEMLLQRREALQKRVGSQTIVAPVAGVFGTLDADGPLLRQVRQGQALGVIVQPVASRATLVAAESVGSRLSELLHASVRFADEPQRSWAATVQARTPAAVNRLPSAALGDPAGGGIATDARDPDGLQTLEPVFVLDLLCDRVAAPPGTRLLARFDLPSRSVGMQAVEALRRLLLRRLEI